MAGATTRLTGYKVISSLLIRYQPGVRAFVVFLYLTVFFIFEFRRVMDSITRYKV